MVIKSDQTLAVMKQFQDFSVIICIKKDFVPHFDLALDLS